MSIWTHVAAIIRIDAIKGVGVGPQSKKDIEDTLGPIARFGGTDEDWDNCTLPLGREGSLQYSIWENNDDHCIAAFTVSIFGDLRDYTETDSIRKWFNDFCHKFELVRQAVCIAEIEGYPARVFQYNEEDEDIDRCPICEGVLDAAGCCSCCGYGRR